MEKITINSFLIRENSKGGSFVAAAFFRDKLIGKTNSRAVSSCFNVFDGRLSAALAFHGLKETSLGKLLDINWWNTPIDARPTDPLAEKIAHKCSQSDEEISKFQDTRQWQFVYHKGFMSPQLYRTYQTFVMETTLESKEASSLLDEWMATSDGEQHVNHMRLYEEDLQLTKKSAIPLTAWNDRPLYLDPLYDENDQRISFSIDAVTCHGLCRIREYSFKNGLLVGFIGKPGDYDSRGLLSDEVQLVASHWSWENNEPTLSRSTNITKASVLKNSKSSLLKRIPKVLREIQNISALAGMLDHRTVTLKPSEPDKLRKWLEIANLYPPTVHSP